MIFWKLVSVGVGQSSKLLHTERSVDKHRKSSAVVISVTLLNNIPLVLLPTQGTNKNRLVHLVDTRSDISVVKRKFLNINN